MRQLLSGFDLQLPLTWPHAQGADTFCAVSFMRTAGLRSRLSGNAPWRASAAPSSWGCAAATHPWCASAAPTGVPAAEQLPHEDMLCVDAANARGMAWITSGRGSVL